ncbi:hypothetical protein Q1695_007632 [Nippostrongylus brasiliensis]|nr:hypothetical protein Q1695_007632 [Nippostrongylus brasiliensis]
MAVGRSRAVVTRRQVRAASAQSPLCTPPFAMRSILFTILSLVLVVAVSTVSAQDREALAEYCAQPQNREVCEQLLASLIEGSESLPQMDKRKPSFVRFGKRSEDLMMEKRKPSFVRFGRK